MPTLEPQFTYHEQELRFRQLPCATPGQMSAQEQALEQLHSMPGVDIEQLGRHATASIDTAAYRPKARGEDFDAISQRTTTLLRLLNGLGQYDSMNVDPVIGLDELDRSELQVVAGAAFQAWAERGSSVVNSISFVDLALRDPFFALLKGSTSRRVDEKPRAGFVNHRADAVYTDPATGEMRTGTHVWKVPLLQTLGDKTRLGVQPDRSITVKLPQESPSLYEMQGTNISSPLQTLSLLCGLGALARSAAIGTRKHVPVNKLFSWSDTIRRR